MSDNATTDEPSSAVKLELTSLNSKNLGSTALGLIIGELGREFEASAHHQSHSSHHSDGSPHVSSITHTSTNYA